MTPAVALERVLARWRATLPAYYDDNYVDGFIRRHRPALEAFVSRVIAQRRARKKGSPHWFELYNPLGGIPRESLSGYQRARDRPCERELGLGITPDRSPAGERTAWD